MTAPIELLFLGSGNAFGIGGRAFSSFLVNGCYLFDCGPTVLQQLQKAETPHTEIETVFLSHFHADHFFGLPFLFLAGRYGGRTRDLTIVGPPDVQKWTEGLLAHGYPHILDDAPFKVHYVEVTDGFAGRTCEARFQAAEVKHVDQLDCFAYRVEIAGKTLVYSGDATLCRSLVNLVGGADVVVLECSCDEVPVHLSPAQIDEVVQNAGDATVIVTHLDSLDHPRGFEGLIVAEDLARYRF